jgi:hypothetical protein
MYWKLQRDHFDTDPPCWWCHCYLWTKSKNLDHGRDARSRVRRGSVHVWSKKTVASDTLQLAKGTCSPLEVALARENLTYFVKGIAEHFVSKDVSESLPEEYFVARNPSMIRWKSLVEHLRAKAEILIPTILDGTTTTIPNVRIAKARMSTGTSIPDPWLLLAESEINYSASNGQNLMPTCPLPEESDSEDDDDDDDGIPNESNGQDEKMRVRFELNSTGERCTGVVLAATNEWKQNVFIGP